MAGSSRQLPVTFPHPTVEVFAALFLAGWVPGPPGPGIGGKGAFSLVRRPSIVLVLDPDPETTEDDDEDEDDWGTPTS